MNKKVKRIVDFLDDAGFYFLATVEDGKPHVRPFGTALLYKDKLYIQTGKIKNVSKQIDKNPYVEISAFNNGKWVRVSGKLINDEDREAKTLMLKKMPGLKSMYNEDDGNMQMLYFDGGKAIFSSFNGPDEIIEF